MKILITGGAGFIGSNLALALCSRGYDVRIMDNLSPQIHGKDPEKNSFLYNTIKDRTDFLYGNVCNRPDWEKALDGIDIIIHLAAETGTGQSMYEINKYVTTNIGSTSLMLELVTNSEKYNIKRVIIASSRAIYGEGKYFSEELGIVYPAQRKPEDMTAGNFEVKYPGAKAPLKLMPTDEESKIHPLSVYGITKQNQEQMVLCVCTSKNIPCVALRYQNVYGPGQSLHNPYTGILSIFSTLIRNGKGINVFEDGKESRDFVYIDDVVNATILAMESENADGQVFNVGSGISTSVMTVANTLIRKYKADVPVTITGNFRVGDIRHNFADLTKVKKLLGFSPTVDFETGTGRFTEWVSNQEIAVNKFEESVTEMKTKGLLK